MITENVKLKPIQIYTSIQQQSSVQKETEKIGIQKYIDWLIKNNNLVDSR